MSEKIRTYDSNTRRKANKQYHQVEKNIFEKNYFSYVGIVTEINSGPVGLESHWCKVKIIPTIEYKEFQRDRGYSKAIKETNDIAVAFIPKDMVITIDSVVLIIFTDTNSKQVLIDILKGANKTAKFYEEDLTTHSINFGIITNILI